MAGPIRISILANASQARRELDQTSSKFGKLGGIAKVGGLAVAAGVAGAGIAMVGFAKSAVESASNAQQSIGATETVFGKFATTVIKTSDQAAKKFGLSANTYRENANLLGSLFANQGVATDQLAGKTEAMISQASDLAATFGGTTTEAVQALGSAFKGEFDPLERYGISIKQSTINAELAARGQDKLTGAALAQAKQIATTDLIMKQSSKTKGAFAKESGTLAHQQQVLGAQFENLKAKIGTVLLPVLTKLLTIINNNLNPAFRAVVAFLAPVIARVKEFVAGLTSGQGQAGVLVTYLRANLLPVFQQIANVIMTQLLPVIVNLGRFFLTQLVPAVLGVYAAIAMKLKPVFDTLVEVIRTSILPTVQKVIARFEEWRPTIQRVVLVIVKIIGKLYVFAAAILGRVLPPLLRFVGFVISKLVPALLNIIEFVARVIGFLIKLGVGLFNAGRKAVEFAGKVKDKIGDAVRVITGLPGKILDAVKGFGTLLLDAGKQLIQGLIDGLTSKLGDLKDMLGKVTDLVPDWKGPRQRDAKLLRPAGELIMQGLISGFERQIPNVRRALAGVTREISGFDGQLDGSVALTASSVFASSVGSGSSSQTITLRLTSEQISDIERGRSVVAELKAFQKAGGVLP